MADRDIYCILCDDYMGVIRDAKLRKDIVILCNNCFSGADDVKSSKIVDPAVDSLMRMFGMKS